MKKKICFSGYYGMKNYGDDLFAITCSLGSKKYWGVSPQIISPPLYGIEESCAIPKRFEEIYASTGFLGQALRGGVKAKAILESDILILGGGSTVSPIPPKLFDAYSRLPRRNTLLAGLGLSVEPVRNKELEKTLERFLSEFAFLSLRDAASYDYVSSLNVNCKMVMARDLVGVLPNMVASQKIENGRETIGLAPCNYESYFGGDLDLEIKRNKAIIEGVAKYAKKKSAIVKIFSLNNHSVFGDDKLVASYSNYLIAEGVDCLVVSNRDSGALQVWRDIGSCDSFLSVRLHGAITAYLNNVPFALVEYHKKCTEFLNDVGIDACHKFSDITGDDVYSVLERMNGSWQGGGLKPSLYAKEAESNFLDFFEFLK